MTLFMAIVATSTFGEACDCRPSKPNHPPMICGTKYLGVVNITDVQSMIVINVTNPNEQQKKKLYRYELIKDVGKLPGSRKEISLEPTGSIETNWDSASCGVELQVCRTYLLGGHGLSDEGMPHLALCYAFFQKWTSNADLAKLLKAC